MTSRARIASFVVAGCLVCFAVLVVSWPWLLLQVVVLMGPGFGSRVMWEFRATDGKHRLVVKRRVNFPADDFLDPSAIAKFELHDDAALRIVSAADVDFDEYDDLVEPSVDWNGAAVRVSRFDATDPKAMLNLGFKSER